MIVITNAFWNVNTFTQVYFSNPAPCIEAVAEHASISSVIHAQTAALSFQEAGITVLILIWVCRCNHTAYRRGLHENTIMGCPLSASWGVQASHSPLINIFTMVPVVKTLDKCKSSPKVTKVEVFQFSRRA